MKNTVGICSGYFQRFHNGHRKYISKCVQIFNQVIVIINNDIQQNNKYKDYDYDKIRKFNEIEYQIKKEFPTVNIIKSVDYDSTVCATLRMINLYYKNKDNKLFFCKDGDRNIDNIAEKDVLKELGIEFIQFNNPKENSSTDIIKNEK